MKNTTQTPEADNKDSGLLSNPLSSLRSGFFRLNNAGLADRGNLGYYWSLRSVNTTNSNGLLFGTASLYPLVNDIHGNGYAMRLRTNPSPLSLILAIL